MVVVEAVDDVGFAAVVVLRDHELAVVLGISDDIRVEAAQAVATMTRLTGTGPSYSPATTPPPLARSPLTSASPTSAPGLLPDDKVAVLRDLEAAADRVTVVQAPTSPCTPPTRSSSAMP